LRKTDRDVSRVTVGSRKFYVYRYEGELNDIPNAAVILSYPEEDFGNPKALRVFISTNVGITTQGIQRYWLIMSLVHYMCCMHSGKYCAFEKGYQYFQNQVKTEQLSNLPRPAGFERSSPLTNFQKRCIRLKLGL